MSSEKGRFSCYIDLSKSEKSAKVYYFLKGLGNLRQDIIIDMVLRTLGDDISLDFEHMSRAEILAVYNENVYVKGRRLQENRDAPDDRDKETAPKQEVNPKQENREPVSAQVAVKPSENTEEHNQTTDNGGSSGIEDEKPFPIEEAPMRQTTGLRQVSSPRRTQPLPEAELPAEDDEQDEQDDLDDLPDTDSGSIASMIGDNFRS